MIYIAALLMILYISCVTKVVGIPTSLSATYYTLKHRWLFPALMTAEVALCMPALWLTTIGWWKLLVIVIGLAIIGVGFSPYKHCDKHYKAHYIMACIAMAGMCLLYIVKGLWFFPVVLLFIGFRKNWLLGVETALFGSCWLYPFI